MIKSFLFLQHLKQGQQVIHNAIKQLDTSSSMSSGVYQMLDITDKTLYVGKAKNLYTRIISYTRTSILNQRIQLMISLTHHVTFTITDTETEALLLEAEMIKRLQPRFNILLRDSKTFPEILICADQHYPRLIKHRGNHSISGKYFGPYANVRAVNKSLDELQKIFQLRTCNDSNFYYRKRPCLLYQMKRCSAPCVGFINVKDYNHLVQQAQNFLCGHNIDIRHNLTKAMNHASQQMQYEKAAKYRDSLSAMAQIQSKIYLQAPSLVSTDIISIASDSRQSCLHMLLFRHGRYCGAQSYCIQHTEIFQETGNKSIIEEEIKKILLVHKVLSSFIIQFYQKRDIPHMLILNKWPQECNLLAQALKMRKGSKIQIHVPKRGNKLQLVKKAENEARKKLKQQQALIKQHKLQLQALASLLDINKLECIEAYDNSHFSGSYPVGVLVVTNQTGFDKKAYRKFNIHGNYALGDDYAFMKEILERRLQYFYKNQNIQLNSEDKDKIASYPDLMLIDGGKGQIAIARKILNQYHLPNSIHLASVVKGPNRDTTRDRLLFQDRDMILADHPDVALLVQRIRDETHRFAIKTQRNRQKTSLRKSQLDNISGIGIKRKRKLLCHFGSVKNIMSASIEDMSTIPGISYFLSKQIYDYFHYSQ